MKLTIKFIIVAFAVVLVSCSKQDKSIYNGDADSNQTLLQIENSSYELDVDENGQGSLEINVTSSTKSDQDRTFPIDYVSDDIEDDAVQYSFDNDVTIPANKYIGSFMVHVDNSNLNGNQYNLKLEVTAPDADSTEVILEHNRTTVTIKKK